MDNEKLGDISCDFAKLATQYYVSGRFAVQSGLMPVGANLLHHALELFLKAHLCKTVEIDELKEKVGHSLVKAWTKFKLIVGDSSTRYDSVIDSLNRFESLRYPGDASAYGVCIVWSPQPDRMIIETTDSHVDQYRLILCDIDELIEAIIIKSGISPRFLMVPLRQEAINILIQDNPATLWR